MVTSVSRLKAALAEQKQKHHGHASVFALLFRDGSLKQFGDDFFHANSILTDERPSNPASSSRSVPVDEFPVDDVPRK